ncbi:hypothetical protein [Shimazuella kribbensis]|uniref:hypothetical protein n=1 Tax=Shimazuella kribbensis TaxID=139808 RepID=UPI00040DF26C|nr:hypothetical protein [Shimazuella kribbensis]
MKKFPMTAMFALVLTVFGFTSQAFAYQRYEVVTSSSGNYIYVRDYPNTTTGKVIGRVYDGQVVNYRCYKTGSTVSGYFGTSNIWDKIQIGTDHAGYPIYGYVSDTYIYTGSDGGYGLPCR